MKKGLFTEPLIHKEEPPRAKKKSVLLIDDNTDFLFLHQILLEMADYNVLTASNGGEALSLLSKVDPPDLILLDLRMEGMSGPDFLLHLEEKNPEMVEKVPIVFLTAMDQVPESRAVGFIRKPVPIAKFLEAVRQFIKMGTDNASTEH